MMADTEFAYARAMWMATPAERAQAIAAAQKARAEYAKGPRTEKFVNGQARIERWLKNPGAKE
jgi:hypothetical protein